MKRKSEIWKRLLCLLLTEAMAAALLPAFAVTAEAAVTTNYVELPITIRDFAADGMLFEWNETGATGDTVYSSGTSYGYYAVNPSSWAANSYMGIRVCTYGYTKWTAASLNWHTIICDAKGNVVTVIPSGTSKSTPYNNAMKSGYYAVWVAKDDTTNYGYLSGITESNKSSYKVTYNTTAKTIMVGDKSGHSGTFHNGDTKGFSLLQTNDADKFNTLPNSDSLSGTTLVTNGTWNSSTVTPTTTTLNSGAKQTVYGAYIRTGLVQPQLGEGKKLVYTEATVTYLANLLKKTLPVAWQNADGTYNMWHVMGQHLNSLSPDDLAGKLRTQIITNNNSAMGTYAGAKAKYEAGNLSKYGDVTTFYEAAYFLLHNTFTQSVGYGLTIPEYNKLRLVETTNAQGEKVYKFNSAYDGAVYDRTNGVIYNTQTSKITTRIDENGGTQYVRGNVLPENRFDPLYNGTDIGYGRSGNTYTKARDNWQEGYYNNTNYNLTLEGHAQFIYYEDADLYFNFTGDDDVYLFINGKCVLDMGGGHSISKAGISLNNVATICGLKDGEVYDFDFYYMERHGTAANFGIETNIRIVDPSMLTTKEGYQNGVSTGYNGYVNPVRPVGYEFGLKNNGDSAITDLTFRDDDIGVVLRKDYISLNSETSINKLRATVYNADGSVKEYVQEGQLTEAKLKEMLETGLGIGEQIRIYGFMYTIPEAKWKDTTTGDETFPNRVYTTAVAIGENASTRTLNGSADWKVQKWNVKYNGFHVYEWKGKGVSLTYDELLQPLKDAGYSDDDLSGATVELCTASGSTTAANLNPHAELKSDNSITYTGAKTGVDSFFYKVKKNDLVSRPIQVDVYSYDVADNTYVLDYGLSVELNGPDFGLMVNDTLELPENLYRPNYSVTGFAEMEDIPVNPTHNYGTFDFNVETASLKYVPTRIMNDSDTAHVNVMVLEGGQKLSKFTGVVMTEKVTTAPASVVYYEENFPGITYVNSDKNQWAHYETVDENGKTVAGTEQSADQNSNYGSDPNYEKDKTGEWNEGAVIGTTNFQLDATSLDNLQKSAIEALNDYLGLTGSDSNGTVNALVVKETAEVMYFDFTGTGFEILSRTTDEQYAVIYVTVYAKDDNKEYTRVVKQKPVITESKGGDLFQAPVISITGLPRDEYRVSVKAARSTAEKTRVLYIDGIRIYGPLSDGDALTYYNPEEAQAQFLEVKQLIDNGQAIYADISVSKDGTTKLVTGTTMVEDVDLLGVLTEIESPEDYMQVGPNNELYLYGGSGTSILTFFLTPDGNDGEKTIEIGAHRKVDDAWSDTGPVKLVYGSTADDIVKFRNTYTVATGTEQYFSIDVSRLVPDSNGRYLVMIGANEESKDVLTTLALTNLKVSGYTVSLAEQQLQTAAATMSLSSDPVVRATRSISAAIQARKQETSEPVVEDPAGTVDPTEPVETVDPTEAADPTGSTEPPASEEPTEPTETTEPTEPATTLTINSAALKADKIVSGKVATLTVKTTAEAVRIEVIGPDGAVVVPTREQSKASGDTMVFMCMWTVEGNRGDELVYTIHAYDANGQAAANTETVTVTIK